VNTTTNTPVALPGPSIRPSSPGEPAWMAAEAIRALNHLTLSTRPRAGRRAGGYVDPSDVDAVLAAVQVLAERLPQALAQACAWLDQQGGQHRIGRDSVRTSHDHPHDAPEDIPCPAERPARGAKVLREPPVPVPVPGPGPASVSAMVSALLADLRDAGATASALAGVLGETRAVSSHLIGVTR